MDENAVERRLAAILAADVVGYSRLMGQDEAGTLEALRKLRAELIDPKIANTRDEFSRRLATAFWRSSPAW